MTKCVATPRFLQKLRPSTIVSVTHVALQDLTPLVLSAKTPLDMTPYAFGCEKFVTELSARPTSLRLLLIVGPNQEHLVV